MVDKRHPVINAREQIKNISAYAILAWIIHPFLVRILYYYLFEWPCNPMNDTTVDPFRYWIWSRFVINRDLALDSNQVATSIQNTCLHSMQLTVAVECSQGSSQALKGFVLHYHAGFLYMNDSYRAMAQASPDQQQCQCLWMPSRIINPASLLTNIHDYDSTGGLWFWLAVLQYWSKAFRF